MAQMIKNLPAMQEQQEMQFRSLGQDDSLEKEMTTHFGILSWEIPWTEEPGGATVHRVTMSLSQLSD